MKGKSLFDWVIDSMAFVAGILLSSTVIIECLEIFMRYFIRKPQVWTVDVTEYVLFLVAFLGAPWLLKKGGHVGVDIVVERMNPRTRCYMGMVSAVIGIFISAVVSWFGLVETWNCYEGGVLVIKTLAVQKHYFLFFIFLGYLMLLIEFGRQFLHHLGGLKRDEGEAI
ncbi:MAG: TRAP transporter small permease [Deltaproteobacteria bacterium]|nr:TRAP transporter small permease [Deltaproteobacteria bacterium]